MITLHGRTFTVVRGDDGPMVLRLRGTRKAPRPGQATIETWALARHQDSLRVLAGLMVCPLRIVA